MAAHIDLPDVPLPDGVTADRISALAGHPIGHLPGHFDARLAKPHDTTRYGTRDNPWVLVGAFYDGTGQGSGAVRYWITDDGRHITGAADGFGLSWWILRLVFPVVIFAFAIYLSISAGTDWRYLLFALLNVPFLWCGYYYAPKAWRLMLQGLAQNGLRVIFHRLAGTDPDSLRLWDDADEFAATGGWSAFLPKTPPERRHRWRKRPWWWVVCRSLLAAWSALAVVLMLAEPADFPGDEIPVNMPLYSILLLLTVVIPVVAASRRVRRAKRARPVDPPG